jgi:hypothetical protein
MSPKMDFILTAAINHAEHAFTFGIGGSWS